MRPRSLTSTTLVTVVLSGAVVPLAACGSSEPAAVGTSAVAAPATATTAAAPLTVDGAWIKATTRDMTGVFATLTNPGTTPVTVVGASSPLSPTTQLHVTVKDASGAMVMQETKQGFTIPAGGTFRLAPGSNHIMLLHLKKPVLSGVPVPITLRLDGGRTMTFDAQGREYNGAKETYAPTATAPGTPAASMSPMATTSARQ